MCLCLKKQFSPAVSASAYFSDTGLFVLEDGSWKTAWGPYDYYSKWSIFKRSPPQTQERKRDISTKQKLCHKFKGDAEVANRRNDEVM